MIKEILNKFNIEGELINITENHSGNINKTFVATFKRKDGSERKYLIQKINTTVFAEPYKLMKNIFKHSGEYVVHSHDKKDYLKKESVEYKILKV